jgi:hypothetical protein
MVNRHPPCNGRIPLSTRISVDRLYVRRCQVLDLRHLGRPAILVQAAECCSKTVRGQNIHRDHTASPERTAEHHQPACVAPALQHDQLRYWSRHAAHFECAHPSLVPERLHICGRTRRMLRRYFITSEARACDNNRCNGQPISSPQLHHEIRQRPYQCVQSVRRIAGA